MQTKTAKPKASKRCKRCKAEFVPFRSNAQYCSTLCRMNAFNQRKRKNEKAREKRKVEKLIQTRRDTVAHHERVLADLREEIYSGYLLRDDAERRKAKLLHSMQLAKTALDREIARAEYKGFKVSS